ncbi:MAG: mRNA surveillance protein pelota [Candidatus Aenigmatarchaeota archaeon]
MKSSFDLKHKLGKITPENQDDLWILKEIINPGDLITSKTMRSVEVKRDKELVKVGRKPMILKIQVEKIELNEKLRLTGKILEGPENIEKGYHSLEIKPGTFLKIEKEWKKWEIERIKSARIKPEPVLICILDERDCDFYLLKLKARHLFHIAGGFGKQFETKKPEYFKNIISELKKRSKDFNHIIIAGPGFAKEELLKLVKERAREMESKIISDSISDIGDVGLQELLKRGIIERIVKISRITEETKIVEKLLEEINKNGKAVYGLEETKNALEIGAVETLLVSDKKIREFEDLLELADKVKTKLMIISSEHVSGQKLLGLGGIAGLLRYKIQ